MFLRLWVRIRASACEYVCEGVVACSFVSLMCKRVYKSVLSVYVVVSVSVSGSA